MPSRRWDPGIGVGVCLATIWQDHITDSGNQDFYLVTLVPLHRTSWSSSVIADQFERKPSRFVFSFAVKSSFLLHVVLSATHLRCTLTVAPGGRDARTQLRWSSLQLHDEARATMAKSHKNFKI
ncbi:hypothetical protein F2Q68_00044742 [Brassica cretica]|uniref:Uncharacterized protein n=1 Tax=Brassica cretica TaxID=69181 RepID=A0A8S9LU11_BRACR|nr:hypothetical protein F2Q68_00044742 [Brassica cretica]